MKKACIFGAGQAGLMAARWLPADYKVECYIDNNPKKQNQKMDGIEVFERLKEMDNNLSKDAPIVALTANAIVGAREQYLSLGFDDYISKPIDSKQLEDVLRRLLPEELIEK